MTDRQRDYRPSPGKVLVKRHLAARFFEQGDLRLERHADYVERDDAFEPYATVVRVGDQAVGGSAPWFRSGNDVTIEPSLFREIKLTPDYSVWSGPYAGVTGVFDDVPEPADA